MEIVTFAKYKTEEDSLELIGLLESNDIEYFVENISSHVDVTFAGGPSLEDKIAIKLNSTDFEKVDSLLSQMASNNINSIDKDHYLFSFSNEELFEVIEKYDEWSKVDYILAQQILKERGQLNSEEDILKLKNKRITELRQPEKAQKGWLIFGLLSALCGGLLGVFIGFHHYKFKKTIATGERVYAYDNSTRQAGLNIYIIGIVSTIIWLIIWLLQYF
jgi:hypothetical protein